MTSPKEEGRSVADIVRMHRRASASLGPAARGGRKGSIMASPKEEGRSINKPLTTNMEVLDHVRSLTENDFDLEEVLEAYVRSIQVPLE
jgi:hypothetical protein